MMGGAQARQGQGHTGTWKCEQDHVLQAEAGPQGTHTPPQNCKHQLARGPP